MVSGTITSLIFGFWFLANFGVGGTLGFKGSPSAEMAALEREVGPLQSLGSNLASSAEAFRTAFGQIGSSIRTINWQLEYEGVRDGALELYGR